MTVPKKPAAKKAVPKKNRATAAAQATVLQAPAQPDPPVFPIVGIGASAGGLAAFEAFFSAIPNSSGSGMAFVIVQHLAPDHKSILSELIARYTRMRVFEVEDGMVVQPDCAYIIPPNYDMAFLNGALHLLKPTAPRGQRLPIDFFSAPWPRTSVRGRSASCSPAPAATAPRACARSRVKAAW